MNGRGKVTAFREIKSSLRMCKEITNMILSNDYISVKSKNKVSTYYEYMHSKFRNVSQDDDYSFILDCSDELSECVDEFINRVNKAKKEIKKGM